MTVTLYVSLVPIISPKVKQQILAGLTVMSMMQRTITYTNGVIDMFQLQSKMMKNVLCWQCVQGQLNGNALTSSMNLADADFDINVTKVAFACIITVQWKQ